MADSEGDWLAVCFKGNNNKPLLSTQRYSRWKACSPPLFNSPSNVHWLSKILLHPRWLVEHHYEPKYCNWLRGSMDKPGGLHGDKWTCQRRHSGQKQKHNHMAKSTNRSIAVAALVTPQALLLRPVSAGRFLPVLPRYRAGKPNSVASRKPEWSRPLQILPQNYRLC